MSEGLSYRIDAGQRARVLAACDNAVCRITNPNCPNPHKLVALELKKLRAEFARLRPVEVPSRPPLQDAPDQG